MIRTLAKRLKRDQKGAALIEFAIIAPGFFVLMLGVFDIAYRTFFNSMLQGAVAKAARDGALENGASTTGLLDERVKQLVGPIAANGTWSFDRKSYTSFTRAGAQEKFTDSDADNIRDTGECFEDENANGVWDADSGAAGQGGAKDITRYYVKVEIQRLFPLSGMLGWPSKQVVSATTVLRNQPYDTQAERPVVVKCT
jgi:Flp pilus assembly pilin Flp